MAPADAQTELLLVLYEGNEDAASLARGFWRLCEVWDDCVDQDHMEPEATVNKAFCWALFELQHSYLWRAHPELAAVMKVSIVNWRTANMLERSKDPEHRATARVLRCSPYDFFAAVGMAAGGWDMAQRTANYFRSLTGEL